MQHFRSIWLVTVLHEMGLHAEKFTWLQLPASWPLAGERLDIDLSEKPACCLRVKNVTNYPHASCVLLVWNNHKTESVLSLAEQKWSALLVARNIFFSLCYGIDTIVDFHTLYKAT